MSNLMKFVGAVGPVYMTMAEGEQLAANGLIQANADQKDPTNPEAFLVTLTPKGQEELAKLQAQQTSAATPPAQPPAAPAAPAAPATALPTSGVGADAVPGDNISPVRTGFSPAPRKPRTGNLTTRKSAYNYESLEAPTTGEGGVVEYQSFHVAPKAGETIEKLLSRMSSNTSAANRRYFEYEKDANGQHVMETYDKRTFSRDASGGFVKDANGKRVSTVSQETRPKKIQTRKFVVQEAQEGDPEGIGVVVYRVPLN